MNEVSLKPVIDELETLFSKFNKAFFEGKLEKPVITVSPDHTRGELKKAIKQLRSAQHNPNCPAEMSEGFETAIQYIRREWLHR